MNLPLLPLCSPLRTELKRKGSSQVTDSLYWSPSENKTKQNKKTTKENLTVAKETEAPYFPVLQDIGFSYVFIMHTLNSLAREGHRGISNEFLTEYRLVRASEGAAEPCALTCSRSDFLPCTSAVAVIQVDIVPVHFMLDT